MSVQGLTIANNYDIKSLGKGANADGVNSMAFGTNATSVLAGIAMGAESSVAGLTGVALGVAASAEAGGLALGAGAAAGPNQFALGLPAPIIEVNTSTQYITYT